MKQKSLMFVFTVIMVFVAGILLLPFLSSAGVLEPTNCAPVERTGQTKCYDATANSEQDCPVTDFPGQDGDHQKSVAWPTPRFTDNGDGTVTDNLTGLIWLKDANCIETEHGNYNFDNDYTAGDGAVTWQHALHFVAGINAGTYSACGAGQTDWRLPNIKELQSLIDYSQRYPPLPEDHPFTNVQAGVAGEDEYWSSTTYAYDNLSAWVLHWEGVTVTRFKNSYRSVWAVRGGGPCQCQCPECPEPVPAI
ncbi:MAG: DUF1566 domain-containing protein, partial [Deltaproteobacteria bacterium]|nr:DUF1566 domain-containing protein [Deltaproteobacteria bacterium]